MKQKAIILGPFVCLAKLFYKKDYNTITSKVNSLWSSVSAINQNANIHLLQNVLISAEDHRFYYHVGFDPLAMTRALKNGLLYRKREGASTIEQQLVRVLTNDFRYSYKRKIKEIILATTLKTIMPRKYIPAVYLYVAYYGTDMVGINAVMKALKIRMEEPMTDEQAAEIIARIKYPESKELTHRRSQQIAKRKRHIVKLFRRHYNRKIIRIHGKH